MGGTIALESEPGKGSEFIVNLCFPLSGQKTEVRQLPQLEGLRALGLRVIEGRANYLLFRADETLGERLEKLGVVVRSCGNYPGLDDTWYRTAVRTRRENDALLAALREVLA